MVGASGNKGGVFVTVGTTKFDALVEAVDSIHVAEALISRGYRSLVIQKGSGSYVPHNVVPRGESEGLLETGLSVKVFDFAPNLASYMRDAHLIISHAGSGSLFEAMRLDKVVVAVPNAVLMDNHQAELAEHMEEMGHCFSATPATLAAVLRRFDPAALKPYQPGDPRGIAQAIEKLMED